MSFGHRTCLCAVSWLVLVPVAPVHGHAQAWAMDIAYEQAFTSVDPLPSPAGLSVTAGGIGLWGPVGLQASFRHVSESGGTVAQRCGFAGCVPGPFERVHSISSLGLGLSYDLVNPVDVWLTFVLSGTVNRQRERFSDLATGERTTVDSGGSDYGVAAAAHLRLRPLVFGLRPALSVHVDRIFSGECVLDGPCWPGRSVLGLSAGFGWVLPGS